MVSVCTILPPFSPVIPLGTAYFLPDSMNLSYSTAILQDRAWRLWAAEQLVLMTFPAGKKREVKTQHWCSPRLPTH